MGREIDCIAITMWPCVLILAWAALSEATTGPRSAFVQRLEPIDFVGTDYYLTGGNGAGSGSPSMLEDLRRGHEGLMVKLNDVTRALKEDELKLNNVFYKLGRHDNDLEGVSDNVQKLSSSSKKIEAKLNKHAFNVDFLRRRIERLQREKKAENSMEAQLAAAREIIDRLEDRLTDALIRLGNVENTTRTLEKRSVVSHFPDLLGPPIAAAARPPTLTVYPATHTGECSGDWERIGLGCYWFGEEELTFPEAVASCVRRGGHLLTLNPPGTQHELLMARLADGTTYWTSATDAFNKDDWAFLMTAQPVLPSHWGVDQENTLGSHQRCAGVSNIGLLKQRCTHRQPYICHMF